MLAPIILFLLFMLLIDMGRFRVNRKSSDAPAEDK